MGEALFLIIILSIYFILWGLFLYKTGMYKVFTKEYRKETEHIEFIKRNLNRIKLKSDDYDIDAVIDTIRDLDIKPMKPIIIDFSEES